MRATRHGPPLAGTTYKLLKVLELLHGGPEDGHSARPLGRQDFANVFILLRCRDLIGLLWSIRFSISAEGGRGVGAGRRCCCG